VTRRKKTAKKDIGNGDEKADEVEASPVLEVGDPTDEDLEEIGAHDTEPPPPPEVTPPEHVVYDTPSGKPLETEGEIRDHALAVCAVLLPSGVGDETFEWMTQGRSLAAKKVRSYFSTCGELAMCVLYCLGYRGKVLNWELTPMRDQEKRAYRYGQNMAYIYGAGKGRRSAQEGLWVKCRPGHNAPGKGDVLFVSNGPPRTEHVSVFEGVKARGPGSDETWTVWQAGGGGTLDQHGGHGEVEAKQYGRGKVITKLNGRQLHGWLDVGMLVGKLSAPPILPPF